MRMALRLLVYLHFLSLTHSKNYIILSFNFIILGLAAAFAKKLVSEANKEVDFVCRPLKKLGIHHFNFVRSFSDGSQINLCNEGEYIEREHSKPGGSGV